MARFNVCVPQTIGFEAAMARIQPFLDDVCRNYAHEVSDVHHQWYDNRLEFTFTARGLQMQGTLVVEEDAVQVSGPLQWALLPFRARIEETIQQKLQTLLR